MRFGYGICEQKKERQSAYDLPCLCFDSSLGSCDLRTGADWCNVDTSCNWATVSWLSDTF
jgi:hypothetical protein